MICTDLKTQAPAPSLQEGQAQAEEAVETEEDDEGRGETNNRKRYNEKARWAIKRWSFVHVDGRKT